MSLRHLGVLLASFFIGLSTLSAQTVSGSISGVVVDPHGAVIPSVSVKLISESTGAIREATTDARGEFTFNAVFPDSYTLSVEQTGFKKYEKKNIVLNPSDRLSAGQVQLQIGSANESISVVAEGAAVQVASSERSGIVTSEQVEDLTVINRDFSVLASLQPGVVYNAGAEAQSFSGNSTFNVNGGRTGQNNIGIQGVPVENSNGGNYNTFISMNAIQEVKIVSTSSQAEYGRKSPAPSEAVVKQGTTHYHGEVYWYQRNNVFNALQSIQKTNHLSDPEYHFITAGANIGGPVYIPKLIPRDQKKFFFFFSEEQQREARPQDVRQVTVPTLLERMGDFSQSGPIADPLKAPLACKKIGDLGCFTNNQIPAARIDPRTQAYLNLFPLPNTTGSLTSNKQFNYQVQESIQVPKHTETGRFDFNATSNTHFYAVLSRWWDDEKGFSVPAGNANWGWLPSEYNPISRSASITGTHVFNPTLIFEGTMTASKWTEGNHPSAAVVATRSRAGTGINLPQLFPVNNPLGILPAASFAGVQNPADPSINSRYPITGTENVFTWTPQLTKVHGPHTFKTGMFIEYWQEHKGVNGNFTGTYTFSSNSSSYTAALGNTNNPYANALLGDFQNYQENNTRPPLISHYTGLEWFIQDNWKATRNLTLDIGVRLGWSRPFHNVPGNEAGFVPELYDPSQRVTLFGMPGAPPPNSALNGAIKPGSGNPVDGTVTNGIIPGFAQAFDPHYPPGLRNSDHVKAAPRFGFAYDPFGDGKTAIRGGFGMYYDFRERDNFFTNDFKSAPLQLNPTIEFSTINSVNPNTVNGFNFPGASFAFQRNRKVPYMINYSFGIQREVGFKTVVDVAYVASQGRHLLWEMNLNSVPVGSTTNPLLPSGYPTNALRPYLGYTDIQQLQYEGTSNYNSLQVAVNRRFAKTFDFGIAYTWSKALDFADAENSQVLNPLTFPQVSFKKWQYGRAGFDHSHIFKASWTYDFPNASRLWDNGFVRGFLDSWRISGITSYQTGAPNAISLDNVCTLPAGVAIDPTKSCSALSGKSSSGTSWSGSPQEAGRVLVLPGSANNVTTPFAHVQGLNGFTLAPALGGTLGIGPRSYYIGPGVQDWDVSLFKQIPLHSERFKLQFRAEVYDLFNHTNFKQLASGDTGSKAQFQVDTLGHFTQVNPDFGRYSAAEFKRRMQLGLTLRF